MEQNRTAAAIPPAMLVAALRWIDQHGSLVDFDCPDSVVPALFAVMRGKRLVVHVAKSTELRLSPAGHAFVEVHRARQP